MFINWSRLEFNLKIVYYGPALSGKTTNLVRIHEHINPNHRSDLVSLKTSEDRTLYFDFMQIQLKRIARLTPRLHLYTVPGQAQYEISRKLVLRGADGVVFVADSQYVRMKDNRISWENMLDHLSDYRLLSQTYPIVVQVNKRDLPHSLGPDGIQQSLGLNGQYPLLEAVAIEGKGVQGTLNAIIHGVMKEVEQNIKQATQPTR